jgi:DNA-binding NarL/FixJ family response regulator
VAEQRISIFLVDDHSMMLAGLQAELGARFHIAGTATVVNDAIDCILRTRPDVVLLDVHMPGGGGRAVLDAVRAADPNIVFLALSVSDAAEDVIEVVRGGARGYVTKSIAGPELVNAIERVVAGDAVLSPQLAGFVLDAFRSDPVVVNNVDADLDVLTAREIDVLRQIARGVPYKKAATNLDMSIKTVETHMTSVLRKLQLSSRYELAVWAAARNIV